MTFRHFFTLFLGIVLALTLVPAAQAASLLIDDSVEAEITLTHDAEWEFGVLSNGTLFPGSGAPGPGGGTPGSTTAPGEVATFSGSWFVLSPGDPDPGAGVIYFVDQATKKNSCKSRDKRRRHRSVCVSDIVTANWNTDPDTPFDRATISFTIVSSACGRNLGALPRQFAGLGVPDPASPIEISGLFRNLVTAGPVAIPSNLAVQFVGDADTACKDKDDDGKDKDDDDKDDDDKDDDDDDKDDDDKDDDDDDKDDD